MPVLYSPHVSIITHLSIISYFWRVALAHLSTNYDAKVGKSSKCIASYCFPILCARRIIRVLKSRRWHHLCINCRYYGMKKQNSGNNTSTTNQRSHVTTTSSVVMGAANKKMVAKPIITVTEFTPGHTPDKVSGFWAFWGGFWWKKIRGGLNGI